MKSLDERNAAADAEWDEYWAEQDAKANRTVDDTPTKPNEVIVQLTGEDGNAFAIIGAVSKALRKAGFGTEAKNWSQAAMACGSYDDLLALAMDTVDCR